MRSRDTRVNRFDPTLPFDVGKRRLSDILRRFGDRLRELRTARAVSQEKLAAEAGLHRTYVSSVERGERNISLLNIERLALALEIQPAELIPSSGEKRRRKR